MSWNFHEMYSWQNEYMSDIPLVYFCGRSIKGAHIYENLPSCTFDTYALLYLLYTSTKPGKEEERNKSNEHCNFTQLYQPVIPVCQSSQLSASFPFNASFASFDDSFHQHEDEWWIGSVKEELYDSLPSYSLLYDHFWLQSPAYKGPRPVGFSWAWLTSLYP